MKPTRDLLNIVAAMQQEKLRLQSSRRELVAAKNSTYLAKALADIDRHTDRIQSLARSSGIVLQDHHYG